jgi:hypothetical protein
MLRTVVPPEQSSTPPIPEGPATVFDWSARLSIEAVRQHCKLDDTPGVADGQLILYRAAAIEAAERYTGLLLAGQRTVTEPIQGPSRPRPGTLVRGPFQRRSRSSIRSSTLLATSRAACSRKSRRSRSRRRRRRDRAG